MALSPAKASPFGEAIFLRLSPHCEGKNVNDEFSRYQSLISGGPNAVRRTLQTYASFRAGDARLPFEARPQRRCQRPWMSASGH